MIATREIVLAVLEVVVGTLVLAPCVYLAVLASVSLLPRGRSPVRIRRSMSLAVLVAAHDEEQALPSTIAALRAASGGEDAVVHVRHDPSRPGKAAALNWLAGQVLAEDRTSDAFVVIDADARPESGFFACLRRELDSGALVVQAANLVDVDRTAPLSLLRDLAFHLICELRPLAYQRLGLSAGLHGNGMCLVRPVLERYAWNERSVVEDGELHLRLVGDGIKVRFAPDAVVRSTMPVRFTEAYGQAVRWERGSFDHFREGLRLIASGVRTHDVALVTAAYELAIPPLSFLFAAGLVSAGLGAALADTGLVVIGVAAVLGCGVYVARGLALARLRSPELLRIGLWLPAYVLWKLGVVVRAALGSGRGRWAQARPAPATVVQAGNSE